MKKILKITAVLGLLGALVSCSKDFQNPGIPGENAFSVELFCTDPATKAQADPVPGVGNENLINQIDYFFFADEESAPIYSNTFTPTDKRANTQTITIDPEAEGVPALEDLFPNRKAIFFAVANYTGDLSGKTMKQIKQLAIEKAYGTEAEMTGTEGTKYFVMTAEQEITPNVQKPSIPLKRIAAKVSLTLDLKAVNTEDKESGEITTWTPIWDVARGALEREATKALLGAGAEYTEGEGDEAQTKYYFPEDLGLVTPDDRKGEYTRFSQTINTLSFYSMPNRWEEGADNAPDLKLIMRWQIETKRGEQVVYQGISDERYYKIMLPAGQNSLDANCWYKLTAAVSVSPAEKEPTIELEGFTILKWSSPADVVAANINDIKYISPEKSYIEFIGQSTSLDYSASGPVSMSIKNIYQVRFSNDGETENWLIQDGTPNSANIDAMSDADGATLTEDKVRAWVPAVVDRSDGGTLSINHRLCNDFTKKYFDATPYVYVLTLHLVGESTAYDKDITIRQYPNFTLKQIESNGYAFVNGVENRNGSDFDGRSQLNERYYNITVGNRSLGSIVQRRDALINTNNNSKYMYLVSAAISDDFTVLDPRDTTPDQTVNDALNGLTGYKSSRNIAAVAPLFIIASSYGKTTQVSSTNAKIRCAAYQEAGYPAGRWRVPTEQEINFLITLRKNEYITELFYSANSEGNGAGYWASSGRYYYYQGNGFRSGTNRNEAVRCIYDAWYWGAEPLKNDGTKDTSADHTNAATNWLGYEFANKISN